MKKGKIFSINFSKIKGMSKTPVKSALLIKEFGLDKDAHAGSGLRQISLLSIESIRKQKACTKVKKTGLLLGPGDFAENITTKGIDLSNLRIGDRLRLAQNAVIEISKIGKDCHRRCAIYYKIGACIMPREAIFARVLKTAEIAIGEDIEVMENV